VGTHVIRRSASAVHPRADAERPNQRVPTQSVEPGENAISHEPTEHRRRARQAILHFGPSAGLLVLLCGGCAERCSYYGMRAILLLYMIRILDFEDATPTRSCPSSSPAATCSRCWAASLPIGSWATIATIVYFSIPYVIGQGILGVASPGTTRPAVPVAGAVGPRQRHHKAQHLDLDGLDLRPASAGPIDPPQRRLRPVLRLDQHRLGGVDALRADYSHLLRRRHGGLCQGVYVPDRIDGPFVYIFAAGKPFYAKETIHRNNRRTPEENRERMEVLRRMLGLFLGGGASPFWSI